MLGAFALANCGRASIGSHHRDDFVIAIIADPVSLNPLYLDGGDANMIGSLTGSYLTSYGARGAIVPDVAVTAPSFENGGISPDGRSITFHLRRDVHWQDGVLLTARDVVFTYHAIMNPSNTVPSRDGYDHVTGVQAPNPYTVVVRLRQAYAPIIPTFFGGDSSYTILPAHLLAGYASLDRAAYNAGPIGSGPYRVRSWHRGDRIELEANEGYYRGKPRISRILLRTIADPSTTLTQLATGEVDANFVADVSEMPTYARLANSRTVTTLGPYYTAMMFNVTDPLIKDVAVRKAMAMAIDRHAIVQKIFHGAYDPDTGMRALFNWAYDASAGELKYDPHAAQALLQRDGWVAAADGIRVKHGRRLEVQLIYGSVTKVEPLLLLVQQERVAGVDVTLKRIPRNEMVAPDGPLYRGHYQVSIVALQSQIDPDASWMISCKQRAPNGENWARYCNPAVDRALQRGYSVYDRTARRRAYSFVQRQLREDMPYVFLWQRRVVDIIPARLKGFAAPVYSSAYASAARWHW